MTVNASENVTVKKRDGIGDGKSVAFRGGEAKNSIKSDMATQRLANRPGENGPRQQQSDPHNQ